MALLPSSSHLPPRTKQQKQNQKTKTKRNKRHDRQRSSFRVGRIRTPPPPQTSHVLPRTAAHPRTRETHPHVAKVKQEVRIQREKTGSETTVQAQASKTDRASAARTWCGSECTRTRRKGRPLGSTSIHGRNGGSKRTIGSSRHGRRVEAAATVPVPTGTD